MKRLSLMLCGVALALAGSGASAAQSPPPALHARPMAGATGLAPGETRLAGGAVAYRPKSLPSGPRPLLILLHGAGGYPRNFLQSMKPEADSRGMILIAPHSLGRTWDLILNVGSGKRDAWDGPDGGRLDGALADLFARADIDASKVLLLGFSDGASYALSLGPANPQLFKAVVALSPGFMMPPAEVDAAQRIFIAHGRSDSILPFGDTRDVLVPALRQAGANPRFRPFEGDHQIDRAALGEALDFALGAGPP